MSATVKIEGKIVGYAVKKNEATPANDAVAAPEPVKMNESVERPDMLLGTTYKIKPPQEDHALYITINDVLLNEDTDHESRQPYEIFVNSKNMIHFQWVIALTRVISAVFRKGGDITFLVEELRSVYDPAGGYFKKGGVFMPSLVAEIGSIIEKHLTAIGMIKAEEMSETTKLILAQKRAEFENTTKAQSQNDDDGYPEAAVVCEKCMVKAAVMVDGCKICLSCTHSACS